MEGNVGTINTPNILHGTTTKYFWASWNGGIFKVGRGFVLNENIFMQKAYPSTININYLAVFNGFGSGGLWHVFAGITPFDITIYLWIEALSLWQGWARPADRASG